MPITQAMAEKSKATKQRRKLHRQRRTVFPRARVAASLAVGLGHSAAGAGRQGGGRFYSMLKLTGMPVPVKVTVVRNLGFAKKQSR